MAESFVTAPDGTRYKITHPDDATDAEIQAAAEAQHAPSATPEEPAAAPSFFSYQGDAYKDDPTRFRYPEDLNNPEKLAAQQKSVQAMGQGAIQGLSFGHATDPLAGSARKWLNEKVSPLVYGVLNSFDPTAGGADEYRRTLAEAGPHTAQDYAAQQQARFDAAKQDDPNAFASGEYGAPLLMGGAGAVDQAAGRSFLQAVPRLFAAGAVPGGIAAAGYSKSPALTDPLGLAGDTAIGAGIGGTLGVGIPGAATALGRVGGEISSTVRGWFGHAPAVKDEAMRRVADAMRSAGLSEDQIDAKFANPATLLADLGEDLRAQTASIAAQPGPGKQLIRDKLLTREQVKIDRVRPYLQDALGISPTQASFLTTAENISNEKQALSQPLYQKAYAQPIEITPTMKKLLSTDEGKAAWAEASGSANTRQILGRLSEDAPAPQLQPAVTDFSMPRMVPETQGATPTTMQKLHATLAILGDKGAKLNQAGERSAASNYFGVKDQLRAEMNRQGRLQMPNGEPGYFEQAQNIWADKSADVDAMNQGLRVFTDRWDEVQHHLPSYNESELFHYKIGAMREIEHVLGSVPDKGDAIARLSQRPNIRNVLRTVVGDNAKVEDLRALFGTEEAMHETFAKALTGSKTNEMLQTTKQRGAIIGNLLGIAFGGGHAGSGFGGRILGGTAGAKLGGNFDDAVRAEQAKLLMSRDPRLLGPLVQMGLLSPTKAAIGGATAATLPGLLNQ